VDGDPNHGVELTYNRRIGSWRRTFWGLEAAFNYSAVNIRDSRTGTDGPLIVDTYSLGGITPALAPYAGTFNGPGAVISDAPTRLPVSTVSTLDADVYGLRLGPWIEIGVARRIAVSFSGGLAVLYVNSDFRSEQSVTIPGLGRLSQSVAGSHSD